MSEHFDLIFVGTGFASSFFLNAYLDGVGPSRRVLVLERGARDTHRRQRYEVFYDPRRSVCRNQLARFEPAEA